MMKYILKLFTQPKPCWTKKIPTELGWYFWRKLDDPNDGPFPVQPVLVDEWIKRTADDGGEYWSVMIEAPPGTPAPWKE